MTGSRLLNLHTWAHFLLGCCCELLLSCILTRPMCKCAWWMKIINLSYLSLVSSWKRRSERDWVSRLITKFVNAQDFFRKQAQKLKDMDWMHKYLFFVSLSKSRSWCVFAFCRNLWETVWWEQLLPSQDDHACERGLLHTMALCSELLAPMQQITPSYCGTCIAIDLHTPWYWRVLQAEDLVTGSVRFGQHELKDKKKLSNETLNLSWDPACLIQIKTKVAGRGRSKGEKQQLLYHKTGDLFDLDQIYTRGGLYKQTEWNRSLSEPKTEYSKPSTNGRGTQDQMLYNLD